MKLRIAALTALTAMLMAQTAPRFAASTGTVSLAGAGTALTVQQPAIGAKPIYLQSAVINCSVACTVTQSQNGTAATATAGTATAVLPSTFARSNATVWTASNVGSGTAVGSPLQIPAGGTFTLDLSQISLPSGNSNTNYSITVGSITGNASIDIYFTERN